MLAEPTRYAGRPNARRINAQAKSNSYSSVVLSWSVRGLVVTTHRRAVRTAGGRRTRAARSAGTGGVRSRGSGRCSPRRRSRRDLAVRLAGADRAVIVMLRPLVTDAADDGQTSRFGVLLKVMHSRDARRDEHVLRQGQRHQVLAERRVLIALPLQAGKFEPVGAVGNR